MKMMFVKVVWISFVLFLVSVIQDGSSEEDMGCVPPWIQVHRSCMEFENVSFKSWDDARSDCIKKGGDLVVISDYEELAKFKVEVKKRMRHRDLLNWWVGLNYSGEPDDVWKWVDGSLLNLGLVDWAPMQPDNGRYNDDGPSGPEDCVVFNYQSRLKDESCALEKPYVCEEIRLTTTITTPTPITTTTTVKTTSAKTTSTAENTTLYVPPTPPPTSMNITDKPKSTGLPPTVTAPTSSPPMSNVSSTTKTGPRTTPTKPTEKPVTSTAVPTTESPKPTTQSNEERLREQFRGCYAINFESTCPPTEALGILWPRTEPGEIRTVDCQNGQATWKCAENPTCWKEEPNVKMCTSENIQNLSDQLDEVLNSEDNTDAAMEFTEDLATTLESDPVLSEQDIYQSTKLLDDVAKVKPKNASSAKSIIKNVVKCGDSLIGKDKTNTWNQMKPENKKLIASSLLNSMETVTNQMMKAIDEPTVEKFVQNTMEVELHVVDVNTIGDVGKVEIYKGKKNSFFITPATLKAYSTNDLSRVVIINYNSIAELLPPEDFSEKDRISQEIISQVMSASIGEKNDTVPLDEPITYAFNTANRVKDRQWQQKCSFWNFSLGYTGAWSQAGCSLKTYNETHTTCQCNHLTNFAILMDIHQTQISPVHSTTLSYITYVGIIISIICLFLSWITFICLSLKCMRRARHSHASGNNQCQEIYGSSGTSSDMTTNHLRTVQGERNSIHKHLVFCLFVAEVLFLAGVERTEHKLACSLIAGFLHYFFLASFTWMFIEGIHILFMLVQVFDAAKSRLKYYYILGYGAPAVIVGVSAGIFHEGYGTEQFCWLTSERFFIWSFAGPIAFILLVNLMILVYAMAAVCKHSEYVFSKEKSSSNLKGWIQGALALEVLLGLTWVFGYFYINDQLIVMAYLFTIFNSLQGLFIFVFHCILNKKVRKEYERFIEYRPTSTTTSNTNSKSANGSAGGHTASYALANSRKPSTGFSDVSMERKHSSSLA